MNTELKVKLDERLVKGEISVDEYNKILNTLNSNSSGFSNVNKTDENVRQTVNNQPQLKEKGFFKKLKNGDFGLAKTYWLYGVLVGFIIGVLEQIILAIMRKDGIILVFIISLISAIYYFFFQYPGVWRAAKKYNGPKIWVILAQITVIIGYIGGVLGIIMWINIFIKFMNYGF